MRGKLDFVTLIVSLVAGCAWWFVGGLMYRTLLPTLWSPLVIALYFAGMALFLFLACILAAVLRGYTLPEGSHFGKAALFILAVVVAAGLFQYVYSLDGFSQPKRSSSYIFLLDDSGSMEDNDPKMQRAEAIKEVMRKEKPGFPFAVYAFTDECIQIVPMTSADEVDNVVISLKSHGITYFATAIETVLDDIESGVLEAGSRPRIILLSDGADMETDRIDAVLKRAAKDNVSISTVGFGSADEGYLTEIASTSGGVFVLADNLDELGTAMQTAAVKYSSVDRTLVALRPSVEHPWIYAVMRCVFLVVLGFGFLMIKIHLMRNNDPESNTLLHNIVAILIGALSMELLTNGIHVEDHYAQLLLCLCFCVLLTTHVKQVWNPKGVTSSSFDEEEDSWTAGSVE